MLGKYVYVYNIHVGICDLCVRNVSFVPDCEEMEGDDMNALFHAQHERRKCGTFTTMVLLHANLLPDDSLPLEKLRTLPLDSKWDGLSSVPAWLVDYKDSLLPFNSFLLLSAEVQQCGWLSRGSGAGNTYLGVLCSFLQAVGLYRKEDFTSSLRILETIPRSLCGTELEGCVLWLTGLGLAKLGKPHTAMLKFEAAVKACEACLPAVYNISRIFHQTDMVTAELECLALLAAVSIVIGLVKGNWVRFLRCYVTLKVSRENLCIVQ